jgi:hypothetical protein
MDLGDRASVETTSPMLMLATRAPYKKRSIQKRFYIIHKPSVREYRSPV